MIAVFRAHHRPPLFGIANVLHVPSWEAAPGSGWRTCGIHWQVRQWPPWPPDGRFGSDVCKPATSTITVGFFLIIFVLGLLFRFVVGTSFVAPEAGLPHLLHTMHSPLQGRFPAICHGHRSMFSIGPQTIGRMLALRVPMRGLQNLGRCDPLSCFPCAGAILCRKRIFTALSVSMPHSRWGRGVLESTHVQSTGDFYFLGTAGMELSSGTVLAWAFGGPSSDSPLLVRFFSKQSRVPRSSDILPSPHTGYAVCIIIVCADKCLRDIAPTHHRGMDVWLRGSFVAHC